SYSGTNGTATGAGFNNNDWFANDGPLPTDERHILNVSGIVALPWHLRMSLNASAASAPPFSVYVGGLDFNGDGTINDLLPGTTVNAFGRNLTKADLVALVAAYNQQYAGQRTAGGQLAKALTLPETFAFNDDFFTVDMRINRALSFSRRHSQLELIAEVF